MIERSELLTLYGKLEELEKQAQDARQDSEFWKNKLLVAEKELGKLKDENQRLKQRSL